MAPDQTAANKGVIYEAASGAFCHSHPDKTCGTAEASLLQGPGICSDIVTVFPEGRRLFTKEKNDFEGGEKLVLERDGYLLSACCSR